MRAATFVVPGRLDALTGGSIYDRRIVESLRGLGWSIDVHELQEGFPRPSRAARAHAAKVFAGLPPGAIVVVDGLAFGALPQIAAREAARLRLVALVHMPLAHEFGLELKVLRALRASESRALASARRAIATGRSTAEALEKYGVNRDRIDLVEPGTDRAPLATGGDGSTVQLLTVATPGPAKGHDVLIRALGLNRSRRWTLMCVGNLTRYPATVARVRALARSKRVADRVIFTGELSGADLAAQFARADLFVLPTLHETYCMAVAEALARGLPVVSTPTGAIPDLVGRDAGLLVGFDDHKALADALARLLDDAALRARMAAGARRARKRLQTWSSAAVKMAAALERVSSDE